MTVKQVEDVVGAISNGAPTVISVFAGRIADTGRDPVAIMKESLKVIVPNPLAELLWASPREVLNLYQAEEIGCHIITMQPELIEKIPLRDKSLDEYSLETVQMFHNDAVCAGFRL